MAISQISVNTNNTIGKVVVIDGNNLIVRIDRGVAGRGVTDVEPIEIDGSLYLVFTFSDGTTETVGPVGTIQYIGQAPIVVTGSTISLSTVPVNLGGTGATTASGARTNLGLGTIATQNANAVSITGGTITGITDLAVADGGTGASTAAGAMVNLLPSYTGNANKRLSLDGTATGLEWVTDGGGTVTSVDVSGGTTGLSFTGGPVTTSGTITLSGTLDVDNGGTGATTAAGARTNLNAADQATTISAGTGLSGGGDLSANRTLNIANTTVTAASYGAASKTLTATVNAQGQLTALADTPIAIANTQISGLGTMSTQDANAVAITGGSITGITDLAVADGGTGASDASGARTNLGAAASAITISAGTGLSGGGDLTANRTLSIANTAVTAGAYGSASNTLTATVNAQGQLTALAATPIAISNTQVSGLGTMSTQNSNAVTITGGSITGITDLAIADGGTGASNAADARSNLGLGTAAVLNAGVALGVATLDAGGTVPLSQIPASIQGGVSYQGAWNASTNTPTLTSSVGTKGHYYVVSVAGNTNLNGVTDWLVGDWAIYNGTAWEKIDNTDQVASVNGYTGVVVLNAADVGAPPTTRTISAGTGLTGGGDLSTNRTLSIANTTVSAASYGTASAVPTFTVNGQGQLTAAADVNIAITNTQVSGLGTMSTQNANSVTITGGSITGITDLAIADGGTGASTAGGALTNLGAIGSITSSDGSIVVVPLGTSVDLAVSAASPASTLLTQVRNTTGATLAKGTVVYISGATGQISTVSKAIATGDTTSAQTLGMITADLANNTNGYVTVFGLITNIDTSSYTDGAQLYLSGTTAGAVTTTKPSAPIHLVYVGIVEYAHPTQGKILVKVQNGYELDEIHDVQIVSPTTGQTLVYNASTSLWNNSNAPVISGTTINNTTIGATTPSSGAFTTLSSTGNTTLGDASTDTVQVNGYMGVGGAGGSNIGLYVRNTALTGTTQYGVSSTVTGNSAATANVIAIEGAAKTAAETFTSANVQAFYASDAIKGAGSTITNQHGLRVLDQTQGTNNYGITSLVSSGTNKWNIYASGTAANYFAGNVGIGTNSPSENLDVSASINGGGPTINVSNTYYAASSTDEYAEFQAEFYQNDISVRRSAGYMRFGKSGDFSANASASSFLAFATRNAGTLGEKMRLDASGNLGLGVTPSAWGTGYKALDIQYLGISNTVAGTVDCSFTQNGYYDGTNWIAKYTSPSKRYSISDSGFIWYNGASTTAGTAITFTQAMTLNSSGNLGIGTSSPAYKLDVVGAINASAASPTGFNHALRTTGVTTGRSQIYLNNTSGDLVLGVEGSSGGASYSGTAAYSSFVATSGANPFYVITNSAIRATFDSSGNLGLGVTPSAWGGSGLTALQIRGVGFMASNTQSWLFANAYFDGSNTRYINNGYATYYRTNDSGNHAWYTAPSGTAGNAITFTQAMTLDASGNLLVGGTSYSSFYDRTILSYGSSSSSIKLANATSGASSGDGFDIAMSGTSALLWNRENDYMAFGTNNTERARIDSSGNLLVGTTSATETANIGIRAKATGQLTSTLAGSTNATDTLDVYSTGASAYRFYVGMGGTVYATSTTITAISDQRLKENIRDLDEGLATVMALKPRKFDWKEGKGQNIKNARGFIAQEFETVLPDMIEEWRDPAPEGEEAYKAINANLIPTLVKAIQEQQAIIESLKARLDAANL